MKFVPVFFILFFCISTSVNSQVVLRQNSEHNHDDHDHDHDHNEHSDAYHCGACNTSLFDADQATPVDENVLHYHGIASADTKSSFHCAACQSHLGYFNHEHSTYEVIDNNIAEGNSSQFYCAACQFPLFNKKSLSSKKGSSTYFFSEPIAEDRILLDDRPKFYKVKGTDIQCGRCQSRIGTYNKNGSGGFGLRLNLGPVKNKK